MFGLRFKNHPTANVVQPGFSGHPSPAILGCPALNLDDGLGPIPLGSATDQDKPAKTCVRSLWQVVIQPESFKLRTEIDPNITIRRRCR